MYNMLYSFLSDKRHAGMAQSVAHFIGSEEVTGSIPVASLSLGAKTFDF